MSKSSETETDTIEQLITCTQIAKRCGYKVELCEPDSRGRRVGIIFRFFSQKQIEDFIKYPSLRSDIILDAYKVMNTLDSGGQISSQPACADYEC